MTHQHYNVFHVVVLLGVKKGRELLLVGFHVIVLVGHFKSSLIASHHLPVAESIVGVGVICKSEVTALYSGRVCKFGNIFQLIIRNEKISAALPRMYPYVAFLYSSQDTTSSALRS